MSSAALTANDTRPTLQRSRLEDSDGKVSLAGPAADQVNSSAAVTSELPLRREYAPTSRYMREVNFACLGRSPNLGPGW